jgi:hypothetical protein
MALKLILPFTQQSLEAIKKRVIGWKEEKADLINNLK